jgi:hypothetical protein
MAGVVAGAGGRIPPDELETIEKIVGDKKGSKGAVKKPMITTSGEHRRGSLRPRRWPDACCCCLPWRFWEY